MNRTTLALVLLRAARVRTHWHVGLAIALLVGWTAIGLISGPALLDRALAVDPSLRSAGPSVAHLLGTDHLGRDVAARVLVASRAFVWPALLAALTCAGLAVPVGALAGLRGGGAALALRWPFTVVAALPRFALVLLVCSVWGTSPSLIGLTAGLAWSPVLMDAVHDRVASWHGSERLIALRAHGVTWWRLIWVHLVIGACGPLIARSVASVFGFVIILETSLSYLGGFGIAEPVPSWGNMLVFDWGYWQNPLGVIAPSLALWSAVWAALHLADSFREPAHE